MAAPDITPTDHPAASVLPALDDLRPRPRTITDHVHDILYDRVVDLTLPPGAKLSEAEVAAQMGVSRQPVRDAFFRLSERGFIRIRPQRATVVTQISEKAIRQAHFIRDSLEGSVMRAAAGRLTDADHDALSALIGQQEKAVAADDRRLFHALDEQFHHDICSFAGLGFVWTLLRETKGQMDRARFLSLSYNARVAMEEHHSILNALRARDEDGAVCAMRDHLARIDELLTRLRAERPEMLGD